MHWGQIVVLICIVIIFGPWLWRYKLRPRQAKTEMSVLLQQHPDAKQLTQVNNILNTLYLGIYGQSISKRERNRLKLQDDALTYGEIDFLSFLFILEKVKPQAQEVFYDLGSGTGKAVFAAALRYDLAKSCGIEILPALYKLSLMQVNKAQTLGHLMKSPQQEHFLKQLASVQFIQENIVNVDISDGDIVFINATCLSYSTWEAVVQKLKQLKTGSRIIVTSKKLDDQGFTLLDQGRELMSWGMNSVNIYQRV